MSIMLTIIGIMMAVAVIFCLVMYKKNKKSEEELHEDVKEFFSKMKKD